MKKIVIKILLGLFIIGFLGYVSGLVYLKLQETQLTFYDTYGKPLRTVPPDSAQLKYNPISLKSDDGITLSGWVVPSTKDTLKSPWLLFCHGNASDISYIDYIERYKLFTNLGLNVLTFDYRGFGESDGTPSEIGLYKDATVVYNYLTLTRNIPPEKIIIYGHSLGTGVAIELAKQVPAGALVVEAGFQSIPKVANQLYPLYPEGLLKFVVKNQFLSIDKVSNIPTPKLFIHSSEDEIFALAEGKALFEKALPPKSFLEIKGKHDPAPMESKEVFCKGLSNFLNGTTANLMMDEP